MHTSFRDNSTRSTATCSNVNANRNLPAALPSACSAFQFGLFHGQGSVLLEPPLLLLLLLAWDCTQRLLLWLLLLLLLSPLLCRRTWWRVSDGLQWLLGLVAYLLL